MLPPVAGRGALERLRAAGEVTAASAEFDHFPEPLQLAPGRPLPSSVLERLRRG
jgi:hypothetical protein